MIALTAGKPAPLGASYDGKGVNFALFSAHAERVELCVFDDQGNERRVDMPARSGDIWHGWLADAGLACAMAIASTGHGTRRRDTASTRPSCCSTPAAIRWRAGCLTMSVCTAATSLPTTATARR